MISHMTLYVTQVSLSIQIECDVVINVTVKPKSVMLFNKQHISNNMYCSSSGRFFTSSSWSNFFHGGQINLISLEYFLKSIWTWKQGRFLLWFFLPDIQTLFYSMSGGSAIRALMQMCPSKSFLAASEFVEKLLIQCVSLLSCTSRHEDVAPNVLMHYLTVCIHTAEGYVDVAIELNGHLVERNIPKRKAVWVNMVENVMSQIPCENILEQMIINRLFYWQ